MLPKEKEMEEKSEKSEVQKIECDEFWSAAEHIDRVSSEWINCAINTMVLGMSGLTNFWKEFRILEFFKIEVPHTPNAIISICRDD